MMCQLCCHTALQGHQPPAALDAPPATHRSISWYAMTSGAFPGHQLLQVVMASKSTGLMVHLLDVAATKGTRRG